MPGFVWSARAGRLALMPRPLPLTPGHTLTLEQDHGAVIRRTILPGGVRVFTETIPGMRSATIGAWVGVGSRDEAITSTATEISIVIGCEALRTKPNGGRQAPS